MLNLVPLARPWRKVTHRDHEFRLIGKALKLAVDFVQRCGVTPNYYSSSTYDVIGFIRVNSTIPVDYAISLPAPFSFSNVVGAMRAGSSSVEGSPSSF